MPASPSPCPRATAFRYRYEEVIWIKDSQIDSYDLESDTDNSSLIDVIYKEDMALWEFRSTTYGTGADNPSAADDLTDESNPDREAMANRAVTMHFKDRSCFNIEMGILWPGAPPPPAPPPSSQQRPLYAQRAFLRR